MDGFENYSMQPPSLDEAYDWLLNPTFASDRLLQAPLPLEANENDAALWQKVENQWSLQFITADLGCVSLQSVVAMNRHQNLLPLYQKFPLFLPFVLLMAETHLLLNDTHGSLDMFRHALELHKASNEEPKDEVLIRTIAMLEVVTKDMEQQTVAPDDPSVENFVYSRPGDWKPRRMDQSEQLEGIRERWQALKAKDGDGAQEFARFAAVKSNELEGVFLLDGSSAEQLACVGLYENCIQGISAKSPLQKPDRIIAILKNAQKVHENLEKAAARDGDLPFDDEFLKNQHAQLLEGANISVEFDEATGQTVASLTPTGKYRRVPCFAPHHRDESGSETQFCLPNDMAGELKWFFDQAGRVLADSAMDPYRACAWLQHAFLKIHPFADGNGRVGRMVSSIPLLKAGLPPVFVSVENKYEYFDALIAADDDSQEIESLASFLQRETIHALDKLLNYVPSPTRGVTPKLAGLASISESDSPLVGEEDSEQRNDANTTAGTDSFATL